MDVSSRTIHVALLRPAAKDAEVDTIPNTREAVRKLVARWSDPASVRACYEAGPGGYDLQRQLASLGVDCSVIAPALIPRRPGDRVKTDRRDARSLAGLFRAGELTAVRIPGEDEEALRDLLRLREDLGEDMLAARHRLTKFLLRHGRSDFSGKRWTLRYMAWVRAQHFELEHLERALREHLTALDLRTAQRQELERHLLEIAAQPPYAEPVARLSALRGIGPITALTLLVEVGDFARFATAASFMSFTGLVPSERSSGAERRQGAITKAGNAHLRRVLVEAAWHYHHAPSRSQYRAERHQGQPAEVVALAIASEERLHRRYWRMVQRGKRTTVAACAVARELAGVIWALMRPAAAAA
jgi:transposase